MTAAETPKGASAAVFCPLSVDFPDMIHIFPKMIHPFCPLSVHLRPNSDKMETSFVIAVALGVAIAMVILILVGTIVFQRWRISDQNVHLKKFINENIELHEELERWKMSRIRI